MLVADVLTEEEILGIKRKLKVPELRGINQILKILKDTISALLNENHPMAKVYIEKAHWMGP
jgi:hypothetical protein